LPLTLERPSTRTSSVAKRLDAVAVEIAIVALLRLGVTALRARILRGKVPDRDGAIAVIITIMLLDVRPPQGSDLASLHSVVPTLATDHHHMLRAARGIDGRAMWANLGLLMNAIAYTLLPATSAIVASAG
jgi:hypothetical protein